MSRLCRPKRVGVRQCFATLRRLVVPRARLQEVDRQGELAELVGGSETELRPTVATLRCLPVPLQRLVVVDRQVELAFFVGNSESPLRPSVATFCRVDVQSPSKS